MISSMTGYAVESRDIGGATLHLELRSVNSRYLDINFRIGEELRLTEPVLREAISARVNRGKLECRFNLMPSNSQTREPNLNPALLQQLVTLQAAVSSRLPDAAPLSVAEVLRWPGMLGDEGLPTETLLTESARLIQVALNQFLATRQREGEKLAAAMMERVTRMRTLVAEAAPRIPLVLGAYTERLAAKLREALVNADEERIRTEVGLFAARIDVAEELTRLCAHLDEVERILITGGAAGKRLDFLMQELNREANTLASKSVSTEITAIGVELKLLIEQMREQVQNLE